MVKYFMSRLIYFHGPEVKPESKISCRINLTSGISGLYKHIYQVLILLFSSSCNCVG